MTKKNVALEVAKESRDSGEDTNVFTTSAGVRIRWFPVSEATIMEAQQRIKPPDVPRIYDEERDREIENPNHPDYLRALGEYERMQGMAAMDTVMVCGTELADGLPEDGRWLKRLQLLERQGHLDLSIFDLDDGLDLEFLYKKHVAFRGDDFSLLERAVVSAAGIQDEINAFKSSEK